MVEYSNIEDCKQYQPHLPEAIKDYNLAKYYFLRDAILDLRQERIMQGLSQKDIAERMGISQQKVYDFEWYDAKITTIPFLVKYAMAINKRIRITIGENVYEDISS